MPVGEVPFRVEIIPDVVESIFQKVGYCGNGLIATFPFETEKSMSESLKNCQPSEQYEVIAVCDAKNVTVGHFKKQLPVKYKIKWSFNLFPRPPTHSHRINKNM